VFQAGQAGGQVMTGLVGLVHSTRLVIDPVHEAVTNQCPTISFNHVLDEGILRSLTTRGAISEEITQWLTDMVQSTEAIGAELSVVSCSSLSPCVNEVRQRVNIPVLKIDEPMMEYAIGGADRIGLVMTNPTTEKPSTLLFHEVAERLGRNVTLVPRLCPNAFAKLNRGDLQGHDSEVCETVELLLEEVDVVMLAQISIARVRDHLDPALSGRVFSSLDFISQKIKEVLEDK
jgi:glutamate racemase